MAAFFVAVSFAAAFFVEVSFSIELSHFCEVVVVSSFPSRKYNFLGGFSRIRLGSHFKI